MSKSIYLMNLADMVSNAFIELNQINKDIKQIPIQVILEYGNKVSEKIRKENYHVFMILSREDTYDFEVRYKEYFTLKDYVVILNDDVTISELISKFRTYLPFHVLLSYMDKAVVQKSLIEYVNNEYETVSYPELTSIVSFIDLYPNMSDKCVEELLTAYYEAMHLAKNTSDWDVKISIEDKPELRKFLKEQDCKKKIKSDVMIKS